MFPRSFALLGLSLGILTSCGSLPPPSGMIAGLDAKRAVVVVPATQVMRMRDARDIELRAGNYAAVEDDGGGVYFESPKGIAIADHYFGARASFKDRPGGIYLSREDPKTPEIFFRLTDVRGSEIERMRAERPYKFRLEAPGQLQFRLTKAGASVPAPKADAGSDWDRPGRWD